MNPSFVKSPAYTLGSRFLYFVNIQYFFASTWPSSPIGTVTPDSLTSFSCNFQKQWLDTCLQVLHDYLNWTNILSSFCHSKQTEANISVHPNTKCPDWFYQLSCYRIYLLQTYTILNTGSVGAQVHLIRFNVCFKFYRLSCLQQIDCFTKHNTPTTLQYMQCDYFISWIFYNL